MDSCVCSCKLLRDTSVCFRVSTTKHNATKIKLCMINSGLFQPLICKMHQGDKHCAQNLCLFGSIWIWSNWSRTLKVWEAEIFFFYLPGWDVMEAFIFPDILSCSNVRRCQTWCVSIHKTAFSSKIPWIQAIKKGMKMFFSAFSAEITSLVILTQK